ncbi:MAG: polysaccharide deacetylase family protein [Prevotellaceae bacterium]|jgi:peptidoglycan/xylan/chitin deacetylase (PgdA/CDA1 family)|nr:polysaccharide deacetylase family protein [Prevotellaceae bacterium]
MKFRYLFITLLFFGILLFAMLSLVLEVSEEMNKPVSAPVAHPVSELSQATEPPADKPAQEVAPAPEQTATSVQTPATVTPPAVNAPAGDLYDPQKWEAIRKKYAGIQPAEWGEQVSGAVQKVNVPQSNERILFLTFNVYTKNQPEVFNFLRQHNIKATLFLTGTWVRRNAGQAREIGALPALFEIGNHGNRNIALSVNGAVAYERRGTGSLAAALDEVTAGAEIIKDATGQTPRYVRSFFNYTDNVVVAALKEAGIKTIGVTVFADGGGLFGTEKIKDQILNAPGGAIILLSINPNYPNIFNGLKATIEEIEQQKLPVRFEHLVNFESYFHYR